GISLAALLILGYRVWPGIFLGALLVNLITKDTPVQTALGIALGNTLEGLVGAWVVNRFAGGVKAFERPQDGFKFTVLAGLLSTMVSATIGVICVSLASRPDHSYFSIWLTWWLGDVGGALLVTPVLLLWWADPVVHWTRREFVKAGLLLLALVL